MALNAPHMNQDFFQLSYLGPSGKKRVFPIKKGRVIIGSSETCDVTLPFFDISPIHALLEIRSQEFFLYDLNSKGGTNVNGQKIVQHKLKLGETLHFSGHEFRFERYAIKEMIDLPPVLPYREESERPTLPVKKSTKTGETAKESDTKLAPQTALPKKAFKKNESPFSQVYALQMNPELKQTEYIFEDKEELYPIFNYPIDGQAVEVIILFKGRVYSVDYVHEKLGKVYLAGLKRKEFEVELAYLPKKDRVLMLDCGGSAPTLFILDGFKAEIYDQGRTEESSGSLLIDSKKFVRMHKGDIEIFIRMSPPPPTLKPGPIISRDQDYRKFLFIFLAFLGAFYTASLFITIEKKEEDKEKIIERAATILYEKELVVTDKRAEKVIKTEKKVETKSEVQKDLNEVKEKPVEKKEVTAKKDADNKPTPKPEVAKKAEANKAPQDRVKDKVAPNPSNKPKTAKTEAVKPAKDSGSTNKGQVDAYKSPDFSATLSKVLAKGGGGGINVSGAGSGSVSDSSEGLSGSDSASLKRAKVTQEVGNISGSTKGKVDARQGVEGVVDKKGVYFLGNPSKTVVLGSMDPNIIRQILLEHLPQFRYCYQRELDRADKFDSTIVLNFMIGASGHVTQASASNSSAPEQVQGCVVNVLKGIVFPPPKGGGNIEVRQPMNFQSHDA
jgi:pSer/pThr/pTyr-binding forkhead associated (FHA) protein